MKAIVLFDTVFGNTERIAISLKSGLEDAEVTAECINIKIATAEKMSEYDLLVLGAPTQYITASKPMKRFLDELKNVDLRGKYGFAFDTKLDSFMAGSAAKFIEKKMEACGIEIIRSHSSAIVIGRKKEKGTKGDDEDEVQVGDAVLKQGMEDKFRAIGKELGELLKSRMRKVEAS